MTHETFWGRVRPFVLAALLILGVPGAALAQQASVFGRVTDGATGAAVVDARVQIVGTQLSAVTDPTGNYRITGIQPGVVIIQVRRVGYRAVDLERTFTAGENYQADFRMSTSVVQLAEIVTTGTVGEQSRRAQAATVAEIGVSDIAQISPVTNINQVLQSRVPGISVLAASGTSGSSSQIRVRGAASISLSNEPLIFIDGVQLISGTKGPGVGGQLADRLSEIDLSSIESIEVVKGPAASTLYGSNAAAGVIQIFTKRGRPGSGRFTQSVRIEYNQIQPNFTVPANFANCSAALVAPTSKNPLCRGQEVGTLVSDAPAVRGGAFSNGQMLGVSWSGRGGGENYGYYAAVNYDTEDGTVPNNGFDRQGARVNFNWVPRANLVLDAGFGLNKALTVLPDNDNNVYGYLGGSLLGSPTTRTDDATLNDGWFGNQRFVPAIAAIENEVLTHRTIASITATWTPRPWFRNKFTAGADILRDESRRFFPKNDLGSYQGTANTGSLSENRIGAERLTLDYNGNIETRHMNDRVVSNLSFGAQLVDSRFENVFATGLGFTVNSANVISAASSTSGGQGFTQQRGLGVLAQWQLGWDDRRYLQIGGRIDANSSFGRATDWFFLPKVGVSWVVSEENFWNLEAISSLRLRAAWGQSGRSPTPGASLTTLSPAPYVSGTSSILSGAIQDSPGNQDLKAERGEEIELGFDAGLLNERLGLEVTYFNKNTKDLLLLRPLPPSLGFASNPFVNIGEVSNKGFEIAMTALPVNTPNLSWDIRAGIGTLDSKVISLGDVAPFGTVNKVTPGLQAGAWHSNRIRSIDTLTNIVIVSDTLEFAGNILPTFEGNLSTNITLFRNFRIYGMLDTKRGHKVRNFTDFFRETQLVRSDNRLDPDKLSKTERLRRYGNLTPGQPAFVREGLVPGQPATATVNDVQEAYIQDADFIRLREVSITYTLPNTLANRLGAQTAAITLGGQNLGLWTDYEGFDPEVVSAAGAAFNRDDFLTVPPVRRMIVRVNLTF
ncbi:MAG: SusC/RagA family TonB-linked outer membrane protein [Gemmatimonadales bacterium]